MDYGLVYNAIEESMPDTVKKWASIIIDEESEDGNLGRVSVFWGVLPSSPEGLITAPEDEQITEKSWREWITEYPRKSTEVNLSFYDIETETLYLEVYYVLFAIKNLIKAKAKLSLREWWLSQLKTSNPQVHGEFVNVSTFDYVSAKVKEETEIIEDAIEDMLWQRDSST